MCARFGSGWFVCRAGETRLNRELVCIVGGSKDGGPGGENYLIAPQPLKRQACGAVSCGARFSVDYLPLSKSQREIRTCFLRPRRSSCVSPSAVFGCSPHSTQCCYA